MENQKTDPNSRPYAEVKVLNCGELVPKSKGLFLPNIFILFTFAFQPAACNTVYIFAAKKGDKKKERASSSSSGSSSDSESSSKSSSDSEESEKESKKRKKKAKKLKKKQTKKDKEKKKYLVCAHVFLSAV